MKEGSIKKFYSTYRLYIFPAVVGICCLILIGVIILPQFFSLLDLRKSEQQFLKKSNLLEAKAAELINFNPEAIQREAQITLTVLPQDKDYTGALGLIQSVVSQNSFITESLSLAASDTGGGSAQSYSIKATITGPKVMLLTLIKNIENTTRVMRVRSIEMVPSKETSAVNASLLIDILYSSSSAQSGSVDAPIPKLTSNEEQLINKLSNLMQVASSTDSITAGSGSRGKQNPFE